MPFVLGFSSFTLQKVSTQGFSPPYKIAALKRLEEMQSSIGSTGFPEPPILACQFTLYASEPLIPALL